MKTSDIKKKMEQLDGSLQLSNVEGMEDAYRQEAEGNLNISDVIEVIQTTDPDFVETNLGTGQEESGALKVGGSGATMYTGMDQSVGTGGVGASSVVPPGGVRRRAYINILEQPASKALRFRYECEGRSAGSIPGVNSTPENKTFPAIQVVGYKGRAIVVVSCVTKDPPYRPHPHNLVGKEGCKKGVCTVEMNNENMVCTFSNLGIQCVKKKDIEEALKVREDIRVDPYRTGFTHRSQPSSIDLNAVRLCFQVFLEGSERGKFNQPLTPVVSDPIYDKKAMSDLVICKLSDCTCSVAGGKEIILLCEKVAKEDIQIRFYEEKDGQLVWEGYGDFQPTHVHKQVAISFRSPRYKKLEVDAPVKVCIQLRRPSDGATSEPLPFEFIPLDSGRPFWSLKKLKGNYSMFSSILAANTALVTSVGRDVTNNNVMPSQVLNAPNQEDNLLNGRQKLSTKEEEDAKKVAADENANMVIPRQEVEPGNISVLDKNYHNIQRMENDEACDFKVEGSQIDDSVRGEVVDESQAETCRSLNDLLSQVAELDEIYSETQSSAFASTLSRATQIHIDNLPNDENMPSDNSPQNDIAPMDYVDDLYETQTYSSLQMAMKNPVNIDFGDGMMNTVVSAPPVPPPLPPHPLPPHPHQPHPEVPGGKREISSGDNKLPPLPPKRIRKTRPEDSSLEDLTEEKVPELPPKAPTQPLPPPPKPSSSKGNKPSLFQKLFHRKSSQPSSPASKPKKEEKRPSLPNTNVVEPLNVNSGSRSSLTQSLQFKDEPEFLDTPGDLTEAEHYALYTDMAPRATVSEFDETSCYYSPVEGRPESIPTPMEVSVKRI